MSAPVGTGVLFRATVLDVEQVGATLATTLDIPAIAPGCRYGPVPSIVPNVVKGEQVVVATLGASRNDFVVVQRWTPRWPSIEEVPGLADALGGSATAFDLAQLRERLETANQARVALTDDVRELWRSHGRTQSRVEEFPDALQRARADASTAAAQARTDAYARDDTDRAAWRTTVFGASDRTVVPQCELRPTQDITGLAANTDYIISTLWGITRDTESAATQKMATLGTTAANPTRVRIPVDGDYDVLYAFRTSATTGLAAGKVMLNADSSATASNQVTGYGWASNVNGASGEGTLVKINEMGRFNVGDLLTFGVWSSVAFTFSQVYFGGIRSRIRVIRRAS